LSTSAEATDGVVAIALGDNLTTECVVMPNMSFSLGLEGQTFYEVKASTEGQCCLACQGIPGCLGANYVPGIISFDLGFGVHLPSVSREAGDGLNVYVVETEVTAKLGNMTQFDAWMDNSLALWTSDLDSYVQVFELEHVPYLAAEWTTGDTHMFSVFVHVQGSQLILELMATSSTELQHREGLVNLEPRLPEQFVQDLREQNVSSNVLKEARISRASTDLEAIDGFYTKGMRIRTTFSYEGEHVSVRCYEWSTSTPQICFTKRPLSESKGWLTTKVFEQKLQAAAVEYTEYPTCLLNRWNDNHYSVTADDFPHQWKLDYIIDYVDEYEDIPIVCNADTGLYYIVDPSGWSVQLPSGIGTRRPIRCGGGTREKLNETWVPAEYVFCQTGECS